MKSSFCGVVKSLDLLRLMMPILLAQYYATEENPDAAELIRGKTGRVYGSLTSLLTTMKGLPLAYNKDMQEDKEPFFDALDTVLSCLQIMSKMIATMKVNSENMKKQSKEVF